MGWHGARHTAQIAGPGVARGQEPSEESQKAKGKNAKVKSNDRAMAEGLAHFSSGSPACPPRRRARATSMYCQQTLDLQIPTGIGRCFRAEFVRANGRFVLSSFVIDAHDSNLYFPMNRIRDLVLGSANQSA